MKKNKNQQNFKKRIHISKNIKWNIEIFSIMVVLLVIVLLSFYPGMITTDGNNQWQQVITNNIINNHPFFSTFFWWLLSKIWCQPTCLLIFQIILLSFIWASICYELRKENNNYKIQIIYTILMCFVPIIFMYAISAWKDVIYSYMLLLLSLMFYIGVKKDFKYTYFNLFIICVCMIWIKNYRYNGFIAVGLSLITFLIIFYKAKLSWKKVLIFFLMLIIINWICMIPEKIMLKPSNNTSANDIIMFITASLVKEDKIDDINDLELINQIYPIEKLKQEYYPYVINSMSFSSSYNRKVYSEHSKEVYNILVKYAIKHPFTIVRHYLKADNLLIGLRYGEGYVYIFDFDNWETKYSGNFDVKTQPIFNFGYKFYLTLVNFSTRVRILKLFYLPAYMLYFSLIGIIYYCIKMRDKRYFLVILPMIYNTISLLPINVAQDLRYVYINYLTFLLIVIPLFIFTKKNRKIDGKKDYNNIKDPKTLVIIPAYNEAKSIKNVVDSVYNYNIKNCDVVVINDGSKDNTLEEAKKTKAIVIDLSSNLGIGGAVQTGYLYAYKNNYDVAIQIDGDGQHNPKYIIQMLKILSNENVNLVIGSRFIEKTKYKQTFMRMLGINITGYIIKIFTNKRIYDTTSGFRAVDKSIIKEFAENYPYDYPEPVTNMQMILKNKEIKEIPVEMEQRMSGKSFVSPINSAKYMIKVTLSLFINGFRENNK